MHTENSPYPSPHSLRNRAGRMLWGIVWLLLFRPTPRNLHGWRRFLLRLFGVKIGQGIYLYPSAKIRHTHESWHLQWTSTCTGMTIFQKIAHDIIS